MTALSDPDLDTVLHDPEGEAAILVTDLVKRFGRVTAVDNLTMAVPRGSVYGFVGPNGAGKTTTLRMLATLQKPDSGSIQMAGIDLVADPAAGRRRLGYMPETFGVYDTLTVREYLDFYGAGYGIPATRRRVLCGELLELVDLADRRDDPVALLSRGTKQRLGLARCLIHDPEILLLDEPASGMDPRTRGELREILQDLAGLGKTILISSHVLPELAEMCTDIGIIESGRMVAEGSVEAVLAELSGTPHIRMELLDSGQTDQVSAILSLDSRCGRPEIDGRTVRFAFTGDDVAAAALLEAATGRGVRVTSFQRETSTLEDIVLAVTGMGEEE